MRKRRTGHSWIERMKLCVRTMVLEPKTWDECCIVFPDEGGCSEGRARVEYVFLVGESDG